MAKELWGNNPTNSNVLDGTAPLDLTVDQNKVQPGCQRCAATETHICRLIWKHPTFGDRPASGSAKLCKECIVELETDILQFLADTITRH